MITILKNDSHGDDKAVVQAFFPLAASNVVFPLPYNDGFSGGGTTNLNNYAKSGSLSNVHQRFVEMPHNTCLELVQNTQIFTTAVELLTAAIVRRDPKVVANGRPFSVALVEVLYNMSEQLPMDHLEKLKYAHLEKNECWKKIIEAASQWDFFQDINSVITLEILKNKHMEHIILFFQPFVNSSNSYSL